MDASVDGLLDGGILLLVCVPRFSPKPLPKTDFKLGVCATGKMS